MAELVSEVKQRTDLVELISAYVPLRKRGVNWIGLCPFHSEKTPSFNVNPERGVWKCFGCSKAGDCFSFVMEKEGIGFQEAGELLAKRVGMEWVRKGESSEQRGKRDRLLDVCALAERFYRQRLRDNPGIQDYLTRRGLTPETVDEFGLGFAPGGYEALLTWLRKERVSLEDAQEADLILTNDHGRLRDRFVERVIFPIYDIDSRPVAFGGRTLRTEGGPKYLNSRETQVFQKGRTLYGLNRARKAIPASGFAVAVEGYMDLIALHQAGITNSVASLGTAITETHVGILRRFLQGDGDLVMCYDGDSAGVQAALRNSAMFEHAGVNVRVANLPEGEDPDTYIANHGADALRALLNRAPTLLDYQLSLLRADYNLSEEANRLPFVRKAAQIIAQSGSHLLVQEYGGKLTRLLEKLADEWYPGDPHRARQAMISLAQEVNRLLRLEPKSGIAAAPVATKRVQDGRMEAERYVLRAALSENRWAEAVARRLTCQHFASPEWAAVAAGVLGNADGPVAEAETRGGSAAFHIHARVETVRNEPALSSVVSHLLVDETPLSDEGLEQCLHLLERSVDEARLRELDRQVTAAEIPAEDARFLEWRDLRARLGGRKRRED